jgi:hypothetical protein
VLSIEPHPVDGARLAPLDGTAAGSVGLEPMPITENLARSGGVSFDPRLRPATADVLLDFGVEPNFRDGISDSHLSLATTLLVPLFARRSLARRTLSADKVGSDPGHSGVLVPSARCQSVGRPGWCSCHPKLLRRAGKHAIGVEFRGSL